MDIRKFFRPLLLLGVILFSSPAVFAQDYSHTMGEDGIPVFEQNIAWMEIPQALAYELVVQNGAGREIFREKTGETSLSVSLTPGNYRYALTVYNLLDKPEITSDWQIMEVRKAEIPRIQSISPAVIYVEEGKYLLTLKGETLSGEGEFRILDRGTGETVAVLDGATSNEDGDLLLRLPVKKINSGDYLLRITNPGGLSDDYEPGFRVRYQKPVDICLSLGYAPGINLMNNWAGDIWSDSAYWGGALTRLDFFLLKKAWGYLGTGFNFSFLSLEGGTSEAVIETTEMKLGMDLIYKILITPAFQWEIRAGGGLGHSSYTFDYEGTVGSSFASLDPFFAAGLSFQWYFNKRLFTGMGAAYEYTVHRTYGEGIARPVVTCGYRF